MQESNEQCKTYRYTIDILGFHCNAYCDEEDAQKHENQSPPGEIWEIALCIRVYGSDE